MELTSERAERISLQAELMATFIIHSHGLNESLPTEKEMTNISLRAKYELDRLPEIRKDLMDEGEKSFFRVLQTSDRLASIEGRLYFEALQQEKPQPFHISFMAKRELNYHREQVPQLSQDLSAKHSLSETTAAHCAHDILRYKETHGQNPSAGQIDKMLQISRELENKNYNYYSRARDTSEIDFLRRKEGDLLFKNGSPHDTSDELMRAQVQAKKSLEATQRHIEKERQHINQRELSL